MPGHEPDQDERLTEFFVLAAALYFKQVAWNAEKSSMDQAKDRFELALHEMALALIKSSDVTPNSESDRRVQTCRGIGELVTGVQEVCAASETPACDDLRDQAARLFQTLLDQTDAGNGRC